MKHNLDRRNLLKGLLALPAAAAVGGWMTSCKKAAAAPTIVDFSIVLHGTYALQFDTKINCVQILIPTVLDDNGDEAHQYLSGLFQNEKPFGASPTKPIVIPIKANNPLPDVVTKKPLHEDPKKFVIVRKPNLTQKSIKNSPLRNLFQLPYPRTLTVLRAEEFRKPGYEFFDNAKLIPYTPTQVPLSLALQYDVRVPGPFPVQNIHYHIFAEPPSMSDKSANHVPTAFQALTSLYEDVGGLTLSGPIADDCPPGLLENAPICLPYGFDSAEGHSLGMRSSSQFAEPNMNQLKGSACPHGVHVGSCASLILVSGPEA